MIRVLALLGGLWLGSALLRHVPANPELFWALLLPMAYVFGMLVLKD